MVSLLDIAPATVKDVTVPVRGQDVHVQGLTLADIVHLIGEFPEVKDMFSGKDVAFTIESLLDRAPTLVYAVIACGTGVRGAARAIDTVKGLALAEQASLLDAILNETFKGGIGPFVATVKHLLGVATDAGTKALASSTRKPSKS